MFKVLQTILVILLLSAPASAKLDKETVLKVEQRLSSIYKNLPTNNGAEIVFLNTWNQETTHAFARWIPQLNTRFIQVSIERPTRASLGENGFAFLICHEMGHFFGGQPFIHEYLPLSVEGQADYFAARDCMKRYVKKFQTNSTPSNTAVSTCKKVYSNSKSIRICALSLTAGEKFIKSQYAKSADHVSLLNRDSSIANATIGFFNYPSQQCRLDTIVAGVLCNPGTDCSQRQLASRPPCWYKSVDGSFQKPLQH